MRVGMQHRITAKAKSTEQLRRWREAAKREGMTIADWLAAAADLAVARGSTR